MLYLVCTIPDKLELRDRPFNLKGRVMVFCFVQNFFFGQNIYFFCRAQREFFFQYLTLGYMTKTLNQFIFVFLHQNQNIFFSNIGNQNICLGKTITPPLQVKWSYPYKQQKVMFAQEKERLVWFVFDQVYIQYT